MKRFSIVQRGDSSFKVVDTKEFENIFKITYLPTLLYQDAIKYLCPYILRLPFIASENWALGEKYGSLIDQGVFMENSIRWINDEMGYGLYAERDFLSNEYIGEYTGQIRELNRTNSDHNGYCVHYPTRFWSRQYYVIDALHMGNEGRFINHRDESNLIVKCLIKENVLHFVFFSSVSIQRGDELTVDYGLDYWKNRKKLINS